MSAHFVKYKYLHARGLLWRLGLQKSIDEFSCMYDFVIPSCHWKLRRRCLGRKFIPSNYNKKRIPGWINTLDWICLEWIIKGNRKIKVDDNDYIHIKIKWCVLLGPNSQETGIRLWSLMNLFKKLISYQCNIWIYQK